MDCDETLRESKMTNEKSKWLMAKALCLLLGVSGIFRAGGCSKTLAGQKPEHAPQGDGKSCQVEDVLKQLNQKTAELESYQCGIEYRFSQPILESETLRKGIMYYQKSEDGSLLRLNFQTLKQDDGDEEEYIEQYIFDGVWLTHIDYQIKEVKRYQQVELNKPAEAFDLVRENFPLIGFSKADELEKEFEIELVEQEGGDFIQLRLKTKADSIYKDDYTAIDFWIDKKLYLPAKIIAISTEDDVYEISLLDAKVNEKIDDKVFEVKIPEGFGVEIVPLEKSKIKKQRAK